MKLIKPTIEYDRQIQSYRKAFLDAGDSMDGCGSLRRSEKSEDWLEHIKLLGNPETVPENFVLSTQFIYVRESDDKIVGMIQVRHEFNSYLEKYAGHIGYSVCPDERRKGYAKEMLRLTLPFCKEIGLKRVLITCIEGNTGSKKTILACGGKYESTVYEPEEKVNLERYWIELD